MEMWLWAYPVVATLVLIWALWRLRGTMKWTN